MAEQSHSIRNLFRSAEEKRKRLEAYANTTSASFQDELESAISDYEECLRVVDRVALFSPNETLEDVASAELEYLQIHFQLAGLMLKRTTESRRQALLQARSEYEKYLKLLDSYDTLSPADSKLYNNYLADPDGFSVTSAPDAAARRHLKISRFKGERDLRQKLEYLRQNPGAAESDDALLRKLHLTNLALCTHQAFHQLDLIAQELRILAQAPPSPPQSPPHVLIDERDSDKRANSGYSERLDPYVPGSFSGKTGPILNADGKPLRPFTLLSDRQRMQQGVFRPDHNLPTMTIDEYLEEERRRGGIIEGGGEQSRLRPEPDEDNMEKADEETMKARAWDEFTEANPKGSGNTLNRG